MRSSYMFTFPVDGHVQRRSGGRRLLPGAAPGGLPGRPRGPSSAVCCDPRCCPSEPGDPTAVDLPAAHVLGFSIWLLIAVLRPFERAPDVLLHAMSKLSPRSPSRSAFRVCPETALRAAARAILRATFALAISGLACLGLPPLALVLPATPVRLRAAVVVAVHPLRCGRRARVERDAVSRSPSSPFSMSYWWSCPRGWPALSSRTCP